MAKKKIWQATLDGVPHDFELDVTYGPNSAYTLSVDGAVQLSFPAKWSSFRSGGYDMPFNLNGRDVRLVISLSGKPDIVADGYRLSNGKPYIPLPKWSWIFGIQVLILIFTGGAVGALCGVAGFGFCAKVSVMSIHVALRAVLCVIISILAWALYLAIAVTLTNVLSL
ncbi:MAG: hypothetical protein LBK57_04190 [Clostridiales Family XIII bacterium]|jgi:hypothetical protein|nr:hypothetical protein [Clostridiales Family XIII bacterium]